MIFCVLEGAMEGYSNLYIGDNVEKAIELMKADEYNMLECWVNGKHKYLVRTVGHKGLIEVAFYADGTVNPAKPLVISKLDHYSIKEFGYARVIDYLKKVSEWNAKI